MMNNVQNYINKSSEVVTKLKYLRMMVKKMNFYSQFLFFFFFQ
jgi:hypothetical protein